MTYQFKVPENLEEPSMTYQEQSMRELPSSAKTTRRAVKQNFCPPHLMHWSSIGLVLEGIASVAPHVCHNSGEGTSFLVLAPVGMPAALNQP